MREAFEIMLCGMGGIFTTILIIMAVTYLLRASDFFRKKQKNPRKHFISKG